MKRLFPARLHLLSQTLSDMFKAAPHKERLTPLLCICLENSCHVTQISLTGNRPLCPFGTSPHPVGSHLAIHQYCCVKFMQSDKKSDYASAAQSLCGVAYKAIFRLYYYNIYQHFCLRYFVKFHKFFLSFSPDIRLDICTAAVI